MATSTFTHSTRAQRKPETLPCFNNTPMYGPSALIGLTVLLIGCPLTGTGACTIRLSDLQAARLYGLSSLRVLRSACSSWLAKYRVLTSPQAGLHERTSLPKIDERKGWGGGVGGGGVKVGGGLSRWLFIPMVAFHTYVQCVYSYDKCVYSYVV